MQEIIQQTLKQIEKDHQIALLYACEAGSRSTGLASAQSDFDVRFIYVHPTSDYLTIDPVGTGNKRDVIETTPHPSIEFSGWELTKALRLFRKSNPSLLEWLHSPIQYVQANSIIHAMREMLTDLFNPKACIMHYLNMAKTNWRKIGHAEKAVTIKQLINVFRPILAAKWIQLENVFPPVNFHHLMDALILEDSLRKELKHIVDAKTNGDPLSFPREKLEIFSPYIENALMELTTYATSLPTQKVAVTETLDHLFRQTLQEVWGNQ
ncbi:nucleotidyltransferase domain-containing protein [Oceanobacillus halotolerans]|uniref:nucleotidyltransferase domain-containing protein n=1 Tax=Oceanobacillus halotolerans TaxID=2663380 RepID=UPI0013DB37B3|nr:nucleotidyltransferase domain-containing protein [Oceanobacillus halotolerans]